MLNCPLPHPLGSGDLPAKPWLRERAPLAESGPSDDRRPDKVAIVHDWLPVYGGAERVLEQMLRVFPHADVFSTVDLIPKGKRGFLLNKTVRTSFLQKYSWVRSRYRMFLPLMPLAIEQFDLSQYELVISSSYSVAKGVLTGPGQLHICYCHSPMRYAWDMQHQYLAESKLTRGPLSWLARGLLHFMRMWDAQTHQRVDHFLTNSDFVRRRIRKFYGREARIIHPPVDTARFTLCEKKADYYVTASRMVPYKMIGMIVDAFAKMPERELHVIGDGPEFERIRRRAPANVLMLGYQPSHVLTEELRNARAFVFAAEEDFGISVVEAQACGTPVIAYGKGGALETVIPNETGMFFFDQTPEALCQAIEAFEKRPDCFVPAKIRRHAEKFSVSRFREEFSEAVSSLWWASGRDPERLGACITPAGELCAFDKEEARLAAATALSNDEALAREKARPSSWMRGLAAVRAALF